jgi:hypothetical protein
MAYPVANSQIDSAGTTTTTLSFTPTVGNYLVILICTTVAITTPSDSKSNTYVAPTNGAGNDTTDVDKASIFYAKVTTTGAGIVLTHTNSGTVIIAELAGIDPTTPLNIANNATAQNTAATLSLAATGGGNIVCIGGGWSNGTAANTPGSGYAMVKEQIDDVSNERAYMQIGASIVAGTTTFNWTANALGWVQAAMALNIAGGGGTPTNLFFF